MRVPRTVAICPTCRGTLWLEVEAWEDGTGIPLAEGIVVNCTRSAHAGALETRMPYVYWLPVSQAVAQWAARRVRVAGPGKLVKVEG